MRRGSTLRRATSSWFSRPAHPTLSSWRLNSACEQKEKKEAKAKKEPKAKKGAASKAAPKARPKPGKPVRPAKSALQYYR